MSSEAEFFALLPSNQKDRLAKAIGLRLVEVERLFTLDLSTFLTNGHFNEADYFSRNSGSCQIHFEGNVKHVLSVWEEQLSIVLLAHDLHPDEYAKLYRLSELEPVSSELKACLGRTCLDVRIWTFQEDFESEEAKEAAVSYVFSSNLELFYCIYLHEDLDSDYLLFKHDISLEKVAACFSLAQGEYVDPRR